MTTQTTPLVTFDDHVTGIRRASDVLAGALGGTALDAAVPTCPDWTALDLLAHVSMVQRWATAVVTADAHRAADPDALLAQARDASDPVAWLRSGAVDLIVALDNAPTDLDALVFLKEAPAPRLFWARRQCHETTIHAADALSAAGLPVLPVELGVSAELAADGIDELLRGFWQRGRTTHRSDQPYAVVVSCDDAPYAWFVEVGPQGTASRRLDPGEALPDAAAGGTRHSLSGSAGDLYLALWNRGGTVTDDDGILPRWHDAAIRW